MTVRCSSAIRRLRPNARTLRPVNTRRWHAAGLPGRAAAWEASALSVRPPLEQAWRQVPVWASRLGPEHLAAAVLRDAKTECPDLHADRSHRRNEVIAYTVSPTARCLKMLPDLELLSARLSGA